MKKHKREKLHEEQKAKKYLGGASLKQEFLEDTDNFDNEDIQLHHQKNWNVELQWFKLLRGQRRLMQIAQIFVELAPNKVFDPRDIYSSHLKSEKEKLEKEKKLKEKKPKKLSKKEQIKLQNSERLRKEAAKRDKEKLETLGARATADIKLSTESGKLLLLLQNLKQAISDNNVVDILDTLWEIEQVSKTDEVINDKAAQETISSSYDIIKEAMKIRMDKKSLKKKHIVDFQLTEMSDRLPPLNLHALQGKFVLDAWQLKVINFIENKKSVLITAPTSSGKTVLSTYVCTSGAKVLFVVPTEPLAWQVAAMLRALKLGISLIVPTLTFVPAQFDVVVGTPQALESALTKQIGFDFQWAIFDEVHSLNNTGGDALQRLIRCVPNTCRFLALSATIGNAVELKNWWEDTIVGKGNLELVQHKARFINLQRHIWTGKDEDKDNTDDSLKLLHPLVCVDAKFLKENGFDQTDMALTPVDSYKLWKAFDKKIGKLDKQPIKIKDLKPKKYFSTLIEKDLLKKKELNKDNNNDTNNNNNKDKDKSKKKSKKKDKDKDVDLMKHRITLQQASDYEYALKDRLQELSNNDLKLTEKVLSSLAPKLDKKDKKKILDDNDDDDDDDDDNDDSNNKKTKLVNALMEKSEKCDTPSSLVDLCFDLHKKEFLPAIVFQLDSVRCQAYFDLFLHEIEKREEETYPNYRKELLEKKKGLDKMQKNLAKQKEAKVAKTKEDELAEMADAQAFGETSATYVDVDAPHPNFTLTPRGKGMGLTETNDVQQKLRKDLPSAGDEQHPLIRALRRGIGVYIEGLPTSYHRIVQTFAQKGRLGIVFSDELLAYGVNMPFRSAVFFGDPGKDWLTPLLHQQMAGRAGRRGLDRQGHLVYCGFSTERLKELLRGELPDVVGVNPLYPTIPLQLIMNSRYEIGGDVVLTRDDMKDKICAEPLGDYLKRVRNNNDDNNNNNNDDDDEIKENYYEIAEQWIKNLEILQHPRSSYAYLIPELIWELRYYLPESIALEYLFEPMIARFKQLIVSGAGSGDDSLQFKLMLIFCRVISRKKFVPNDEFINENDNKPLPEWYGALPSPHSKDDDWNYWTDLIKESQDRIINSSLPYKEQMLLDVDLDAELDNQCYACFVRNQLDPSLATKIQHDLRQRLWNIGEVLRICTNVFGRSPELTPIQSVMQKSFVRLRYILQEQGERNWNDFTKFGNN